MKSIVKKIARIILAKELSEYDSRIEKQVKDYEYRISKLVREKETLEKIQKELTFRKNKVLISKTMMECIVKMLPDPNQFGTGNITVSDLNLRTMSFTEELKGRRFIHSVKFINVIGGEDKNIQGLTIHISDYNINVFIPLRRENINYIVYDVSSAIDTYFWDFHEAGIRMVSDEAWAVSTEFITAQNNVLTEFRELGLL